MEKDRVLVVDGQKKWRSQVSGMLKLCGYKVDTCGNGEVALQKLHHNPCEVVLLDLHLPGKNGFIIANKINCDDLLFKPSLIAMTIYPQGQALDRLLNVCGIKRVLYKPFYPLDLISNIEDAIFESRLDLSDSNR